MLTRLFQIICILLTIALGIIYLTKYSTPLRIELLDLRLELDVLVACALLIGIFLILWLLISTILYIFNIPSSIKNYFLDKSTASKIEELEEVVVAIIDGQNSLKLRKHLNHTDEKLLALYLKYQISKIEGDIPGCKSHILAMLKSQDTYVTGLTKFIEISATEGNWHNIVEYSDQLLQYAPSTWADSMIIKAHLILHLWEELSEFIEQKKAKLTIKKPTISVLHSVLLYKKVENLFYIENSDSAASYSKKLLAAADHFAPCLVLLADIKIHQKLYKEAALLISKHWDSCHNILIGPALRLIRVCPISIIAKTLNNIKGNHPHSLLLNSYISLLQNKPERIEETYLNHIISSDNFFENLFLLEYKLQCRGNLASISDLLTRMLEIDYSKKTKYYWDHQAMKISSNNPEGTCIPITTR